MFAKIFGNQPIGLGYKVSRLVTKLPDGLTAPHTGQWQPTIVCAPEFSIDLDGLQVWIHVEIRWTQLPTSIEAQVSRSLHGVPVKQGAVLSIVDSQMPVAVARQVPDFKNPVFAQS